MKQTSSEITLDTLVRKKIEKLRRKEKDARLHKRLSALLWLHKGYTTAEISALLDVDPRTVKNWVTLFQTEGLEALCSLAYQGDPG
jgi:transposase